MLGCPVFLQLLQGRDHQGYAHPVVEGFGEVGLAVRHLDERSAGVNGIARLDAGGFDFGLAGGADVDVHILLLDHLLALFSRQQVRRLGADDANHIALAGLDDHALPEQHLVEPAAQRQELDEAILGDVLDHEADLVHVPGEHHPRRFGRARLVADHAADLILGERAQRFQVFTHHGPDRGFISGHARRFGQFFQELCSGIHKTSS